ncbi:MAG: hypothetical protein RPU63_15195 [Candidatus Sedimenticola sp. (ex Thyasira tokunagai)]
MDLAYRMGSATEVFAEMKQEKKRIKVLTLVEGAVNGCGDGVGSLFLIEPLAENLIPGSGSFHESIVTGYDAMIIPAEDSEHLLPRLVGHIPLVAISQSPDINTVLKLLGTGVDEVLSKTDCQEGRLAYAVMTAMARFRCKQSAHSAAEVSPKIEERALQTLDRLPFGVMFITPDSQVLFMNSVAEDICKNGSGLYLSDSNHCCVRDRDENALLHRTVRRVAEEHDRQDEGPYTLNITGDSKSDGLSLLAVPVGSDNTSQGVALFLSGSGGAFDISVDTIKLIYRFTSSEAQLVIGLVHGFTLAEIAKERDVTLHTVRAQLKSVFSKTGAKRQAELIKQILTGPAVLVKR